MSISQYQYWLLQVSTFGKFPKMPNKMLKYWQKLWPLSKFHLFLSLGTATCIIWLQFGKFLLFPPYVWLIGSKSSGIFQNFIIKSAVDHASHIILCLMYGQTQNFYYFPHVFGSSAIKAMAFIKISSFSSLNLAVGPTHTQYCVLCMVKHKNCCYFPIGLAHWL